MAECNNCGATLAQDAKYCSKCGTQVGKVITEEFAVSSEELIGKIKEILHEGTIRKIIVKNEEGKTLLEIPAWAGVVGAIMAPWLAALGAIAALATSCTITVVRQK